MKTTHLTHRITSVILSLLMLTSMLVLPETAGLAATTASAETLTQAASGEHLTEVPEGYTAVRTIEDLYAIRSNPSGKFILMNDIDLSATAPGGEWDGGNGWTPIPEFSGTLNGNGYVISNMNIYGDIQYSGFIDLNIGTVTDLHFEDVNISIDRGTNTNETCFGTVARSNCNSNSIISKCSVSGNVNVTSKGGIVVGGITADNSRSSYSSKITECYNKASIDISGGNETIDFGGITGNQYGHGNVTNCYNAGVLSYSATGTKYCGGILGYYNGGSIQKCINFTDGRITGIGITTTDCYCLAGSTFGYGGTELTAPLMKQQASYLNFDFTDTWEMFNKRPQLKNNAEFIPTKITVKQKPSKIIYGKGDTFTVDGTLEVACKDGTVGTVDITPEMVSNVAKSAGTQNVKITYRGFSVTASVPVEINEEIPEGYTPIYNIAQLYAIRQTPAGKFILMNDIDMSATAPGGEWDGGNGWTPIPEFSGTLNGNGYVISNMNIYGDIQYSGFIDLNIGTVTDLHFEDVNISIDRGTNTNETCFGTVARSNCNSNSIISKCSVSGNVNVTSKGGIVVGGITADNSRSSYSSKITECYNKASIDISGGNETIDFGGITGNQYGHGNVTNCYNAGVLSYSATGTKYCGGILGYYNGGSIQKCINFTDGRITGIGITTTDCYCLAGSTFGYGGTELTAPLMKQQASYLNFDFTDTWEMFNKRPQLKNNPEFRPVSMQFKQRPTKLSFNCGDSFAVDGTLEVTYTGGVVLDMPITEDMASGYDMTKVGSQTVTVTFGKLKLTYPINVLEVFATGVKLDKTSEKIVKGNTLQLKATITPDNTTNKTITWTSSDSKAATVDANGKVTAVAPGKATITAATANGKKATCAVTVIIPAENITLDKNYASINKGETLALVPTLTPSDSTDKLTWASSDGNVATVDGNGTITAKGAGTANITVTAESGVFASCFVEVVAPAKSLTLSSNSLDMIAGGSETLTLTVDPSDTTDDIEWSASSDVVSISTSDDKRTATVYANSTGTATITVTASSGVSAECAVKVIRRADEISFNEYYKTLEKGETYTAVPVLDPSNSSDKITWHSDNPNVASVDDTGRITAINKGTANISAQIMNGKTATVTVEVTVSPTSIKLDKNTAEIVGMNSVQLFAVIAPDDADKTVRWSSSDNNIAYVDGDGNVYGVSSGTATITAETANGLTDSCNVTVKFIDISKSTIKLEYTETVYDGSEKTPKVTVTNNGETLTENTDYTVLYENNNSVGTATVKVTGIGNYEGTNTATFTIKEPPKVDISKCTATLNQTSFYYDGYEKKPSVTVRNGSTTLYENTDYTVSYKDNRNIGTATVTITGIGGYTGTKKLTFTIEEKPKTDISGCTISLSPSSYTYNGTAREPLVTVKDGYTTLTKGTDFTVSYSNNVNVGTATATVRGIGNYTGTKTATFSINEVPRTNISNCTVTLSKTSYIYDGTAKRPTPTVKYGSTTLYQGTDYTVSYGNNIQTGTATVTITGIGNYTGTKTATFSINPAPKTNISNCSMTLSQTTYTYDGGAKTPTVTLKYGAATLVNNTDYTVSYSNNTNAGTATVTATGRGNYEGTKTATFIIKSPTPVKTPFTWGTDNWNFLNSSYSGDFSSGTYRSQINSTYKNALKENLTASEYQAIFIGSYYSNAWLDEKFGGSCYGMSSTTLLAKQGFLPYSSYKSGATKLHDLDRPTSNTNVSSLITYYQMLQVKSVTQQQYRTVPKRSHETNINEIISLLDENDTVLLGFQKANWGGHAILAYDYEYGSWTKGGVSYGARIKICDPNSSTTNDDNYYIYFNTRTYAWAIPAYTGITSAKGATFNYIGANIDEINQGGYLSGSSNNRSEGFIARIDAFSISHDRSVAKVQAGENGNYLTMNTAAGDIEEDYSYVLGNESEGTIGYNLRDGNAAYMITQGDPDELELAMTYENCSMIGGSKAGESVIFDKSGYIEVQGQSAEYAMSITMDDEHPTDWFTVAVKGQGADNATLKQVENGWVVASDSLNNVEVTVNNKYDMAYTTFTTEYPAALIYEIDEDTIGIAVDKDNNGTYETTLDTKTSKSNPDDVTPGSDEPIGNLGDIDDDGEITANDALTILRSSVGMTDLTPEQTKLADVDNDGEITANDALAVLRYSVGMADSDSPINKPIAA